LSLKVYIFIVVNFLQIEGIKKHLFKGGSEREGLPLIDMDVDLKKTLYKNSF